MEAWVPRIVKETFEDLVGIDYMVAQNIARHNLLLSGSMGGTYFIARLAVAFAVPLTLASLGPATSHPELGTDMATTKRNKSQVYRAQDVAMETALREYSKREPRKVQAYRKGRAIHLEPKK